MVGTILIAVIGYGLALAFLVLAVASLVRTKRLDAAAGTDKPCPDIVVSLGLTVALALAALAVAAGTRWLLGGAI